jgi:hypothetical protein
MEGDKGVKLLSKFGNCRKWGWTMIIDEQITNLE